MKSLKKVRKTDIYKALCRIGLKDVTTKRQQRNGTLAMYDPESGATYTFCASGYYRREYSTIDYSRDTFPFKDVIYQLNPREKLWGSTTTITFPHEYTKMMILALGPIHSYRKSVVKQKLKEGAEFAKQQIEGIINYITK